MICLMGLLAMGGMVTLASFRLDQNGQHFGATPLFCGLGTLLALGMFMLLLVGGSLFFRFRAWKAPGGPKGEGWGHHPHRHPGPMPPWCWGQEKAEEKAEEAGRDPGTGAAEAEG
jgi:hypothetical protein